MSKLNKAYKSKFGEMLAKEKEQIVAASQKPAKTSIPRVNKAKTEPKVSKSENKKNQLGEDIRSGGNIKSVTFDDMKDINLTTEQSQKVENSNYQTVNTSSNQRILRGGKNTKSKTFFLPPEFHEMFEYIKWKKKADHSKYMINILEEAFTKEFGSEWRSLLSD
jgi:hypothetical protein